MNSWTPSAVIAVIVAISAPITALFTPAAVKAYIELGDWWLKRRRELSALKAADYKQNDLAHKKIITWYDDRITELTSRLRMLEERCDQFQASDAQCKQDLAVVKTEYASLKEDYDFLSARLIQLEGRR